MLSVIIPAYNAAQTLDECLRALQQQTLPSEQYEIIVVDDGSTDSTAPIARQANVCVITQSHSGPAAARDTGVAAARGEFVLFTDADCAPQCDWLAQMTSSLTDANIVGVKGAYATRQREIVARLAQLEFEERYDRLQKFRYVDFFDTHALALRKSALQSLGDFDTFFPAANNEDVDLAYRFAERGCRLVFNRAAIVYHRHPPSWQRYAHQKFWRGYWRMQVYQRYPQKIIADSYTPQTLKLQVALLALVLLALPFVLIASSAVWLVVALCGALWLTGIPLSRVAWRHDRVLLPLVPLFIVVRALAVGCGSAVGLLTVLHLVPLLRPRAFAHEQ